MWCFYSNVWVKAVPTVEVVTEVPTYERYFENQSEQLTKIRGWLPIPTDWFFGIREN